ncbi:MAG: 3-oxoacyl-acyl-carrier protein reductase [Spirochaetes bacterium]|nr:MAG: 3-oxoacyl-acyl-carrier protein reductase [Spirochaetota bacterium]
MNRMEGKVCVVTGGARGIGRAIVDRFAEEGARMVFALDVGDGAFKELEVGRTNVKGAVVNVTDTVQIQAFVEKVVSEFGAIDVLVNNAGITKDALIQKMSDDDWSAVIGVNLTGVFKVTRAVAPQMMAQGRGAIVSISSVVGLDGNIGQSNYAATKGGVVAMTKGWAKEFARKGAKVRANSVSPGYCRTPMIESVPEKVLEPIIAKTPLQRLAMPIDIANAVLFLCSDESEFITGQVLRVDGGLVL